MIRTRLTHSFRGARARSAAGATAALLLLMGCASRTYHADPKPSAVQQSNSTNLPPKPRIESHWGPISRFDERNADGTKPKVWNGDLVSHGQPSWSCRSRPEVTVCRGKNGAGNGDVLWIRYRGAQGLNFGSQVFAHVTLQGEQGTFPMFTDAGGAFALLTDGPLSCTGTKDTEIYSGEARSRCKNSTPEMKKLFSGIDATMSHAGVWRLDLEFEIQEANSSQAQKDKGTPPFSFQLSTRVQRKK